MPAWLADETIRLLLDGLLLTLALTAATSIASLALGILVGTMRLSGRRAWRRMAGAFVDIHRNVPALVLIIFWAFAVPNLFPQPLRSVVFFDNSLMDWLSVLTGLSLPFYLLAAALALTLNTAAYIAELFRAGVGTIRRQQLDAARTLGAAQRSCFWRLILPQGVRAAFPAMSTRLIHNMKNTALASFVAVPEFFQATQSAMTATFRAVEFLALATVTYLALSFGFAILLEAVERRLSRRPRRAQRPNGALDALNADGAL
jgi:polar amino acid transport system permease protein